MFQAIIKKNDKRAKWLIAIVSIIIFAAVVALDNKVFQPTFPFDFDVHNFALFNAVCNTIVSCLLIVGLWSVKQRKYVLHKQLMFAAIICSVLFLLSYICHHLFAGDTRFGDINHDGVVSPEEIAAVGSIRYVYLFILLTHIVLAALILPFILFTAYRALTAEFATHKKIARYTWPLWLYISITGVIVYLMISPYYT
jgi:putative membrane protein